MMVFQVLFIGVVLVFIFIFNAVVMRRNQVDRIAVHIKLLLARRREIAAELAPELSAASTASVAAELAADRELERALNQQVIRDAAKFADFQSCGTILESRLGEYRHGAAAYNQAVSAIPVCWIARGSRFAPREMF